IEAMQRNGWRVGGESSGHIVCSDVTTTGDGIISALQVMRALIAEQQSLHELKQRMQKLPQVMINVPVISKVDLSKHEAVQRAVADAETRMEGQGRVLLRASGTEPVIRVMVEGQRHGLVDDLAKNIADAVKSAVT
nr:phosphoglucosamine mutase [Cellvibrionaceae bacterium]